MEEIQEINLHIDGKVFPVKKDVLCEYSDYFRAMFSGNYIEKQKNNITIDVVDANSMNIILRYMDLGFIDLSEYTLQDIGNLAMAANFLQVTELMKQIEYCLGLQLTQANCMKIMAIAEQSSYLKLKQLSVAFGLESFKSMKPKYIPTIDRLFWYLSHPYLDTDNEIDVFKFGLEWISHTESGGDALLIILGCLDVKRLTSDDLKDMLLIIKDYENSLAEKVLNCLDWLCNNEDISLETLTTKRSILCESFTERVYKETYNIVMESKQRKLKYTPVVPMWNLKNSKLELSTHFMYTFSEEKGFEKWLEVADKHLWGWNATAWGSTKLVIVCGEYGRGTGSFMRDVKIYDTLSKEWISHGVQLPPRRHGGVTVLDDCLYIVGGIGKFRVVLETAIVYNLKERTYREIAKLPDAIQSPAICSHKGSIYVAGFGNVYVYKDLGQKDFWSLILTTEIRPNYLISMNDYIYCCQNYFSSIHGFRPGVDSRFQMITNFSHPPAAVCSFRTHLLVFTRPICCVPESIIVEEFRENKVMPKCVWSVNDSQITINDVAGSCVLVMDPPPLHTEVSTYHQKYLSRYSNVYYDYEKSN